MHGLTVLHIEDVLPSAPSFLSNGGVGNSPNINLPHLTHLVVAAPLSTVVALLSCVSIPSKIQLGLAPQSERGASIDDYYMILSFIAERLSITPSSAPTFRSSIINASFTPKLTFSTL